FVSTVLLVGTRCEWDLSKTTTSSFWHQGGGQSAPYERISNVLSRDRGKKTRQETSAGSVNASGMQSIQGAVNLSHLTHSRSTGVGRERGFCFVPVVRRVQQWCMQQCVKRRQVF
ncbi:unnamed protein product, partial [Laminaria digitata]